MDAAVIVAVITLAVLYRMFPRSTARNYGRTTRK